MKDTRAVILVTMTVGSIFLAVVLYGADIHPVLMAVLSLLPPWMVAWHGVLYDNWERYRIMVHHIRGLVTNQSTRWRVVVEYQVDNENARSILAQVSSTILTIMGRPSEVWQDSDTQKILQIDGITLRLRAWPGSVLSTEDVGLEYIGTFVRIEIPRMDIPYKKSRHAITALLLPLFEGVSRELKPTQEKYTFHAFFDDSENPYYGYLIRQVPLEYLREFAIELAIPMGTDVHSVSIRRSELVVTATRLTAMGALAQRYLGVSASALPIN